MMETGDLQISLGLYQLHRAEQVECFGMRVKMSMSGNACLESTGNVG